MVLKLFLTECLANEFRIAVRMHLPRIKLPFQNKYTYLPDIEIYLRLKRIESLR